MTISPQERRWLLGVTLIGLLLANLPSLLGALFPPHGTVYTGIDATAPGDLNVYRSYMEQVVQGKLILRDLFTSESQRAWIVSPFWIMLGAFSSLFHISTLAVYFIARILLGAALLFVIYRLAAEFFDEVRIRKLAFLLATFGAGLGAIGAIVATALSHWLPHALQISGPNLERVWPMDLWVSEAFTFLSLHHSPHFVAATLLILLSVAFLGRSLIRNSRRDAVYAGLSMLALYSFHPFHVLSLGMTTLGFLILTWLVKRPIFWRTTGNYVIAWLVAAPALLYQIWAVVRDPFGQARAEQNILLTPPLPTTIVSYGLLLIGAVAGAVVLLKRKELKYQILVVWAICHFAAIYLPVFFNRRVTQGLNVALGFLAAVGTVAALEYFRRRTGKRPHIVLLSILAFFGFGLSMVWVSAQDLSFLMSTGRVLPYFFYLPNDYRDAFRWLKTSTQEDAVILSAPITGNFIPGWSGRAVVVGHNVETLHFQDRSAESGTFFNVDSSDQDRQDILRRHRVGFVIVGPWENRLGSYDPATSAYLVPVFRSPTVTIYRSTVN